MLHENGTMEATLAAAAGSDPALMAELRVAFSDSLAGHIDLLKRARCDGNWEMAALRLKGLAAGFHADGLIELADLARDGPPGEPTVIRRLEAFLAECILPVD